jgi:hypothetical protein
MKKYYKVISANSLFTIRYDIQDTSMVPVGTCFVAKRTKYEPETIIPALYFSDCAFDAMLWWQFFNQESYYSALIGNFKETCVYNIKPLTKVYKERTKDNLNYYQCKTDVIEFGELISIENLARDAIEEYKRNKLKKYFAYGRKFVKEHIEQWQSIYGV